MQRGHHKDEPCFTKCTRPGCGEHVQLFEIDEHLEMHEAMHMSATDESEPLLQESRASSAKRSPYPQDQARKSSRSGPIAGTSQTPGSLLDYFKRGSDLTSMANRARSAGQSLLDKQKTARAGKGDLGPYAYEAEMPAKVMTTLLEESKPRPKNRIGNGMLLETFLHVPNQTPDLIPLLANLFSSSENATVTYLCSPAVCHISRIKCEGEFCGYWNIQMVCSGLRTQRPANNIADVPNVFQIQDVVEEAWKHGICAIGKTQTGGIRNTRKWIGSLEAVAFFRNTNTQVDALSFKSVKALLDHVEAYFMSGLSCSKAVGSSRMTKLPAVYFQRRGHSMTCVGLERKVDGSRNLLVFDPSWSTTEPMRRMLAGGNVRVKSEIMLKPYRKSEESLGKWAEFELVTPINPTK